LLAKRYDALFPDVFLRKAAEEANPPQYNYKQKIRCKCIGFSFHGRGDWIRTSGLYVPNVALYQAEPHLEKLSPVVWGYGCGRRIRTLTYRVRVCCATITQFRNVSPASVRNSKIYYTKPIEFVNPFSGFFGEKQQLSFSNFAVYAILTPDEKRSGEACRSAKR
jgi:hypothetical protein